MLSLDPAAERIRRSYYYDSNRKEDIHIDYSLPIQEIIVNGSIYNRKDWQLGEEYNSPLKE